MVSTELGACEWFVWDLRRSNLIERGQLEQIVGDFLARNPRAEPADLANHLVEQNILTSFQAERLLAGKTQGFVLGPFTLMEALGTGSMGTVYKAQSKNDNGSYAVKVLPRRSMWNIRIARRKVREFEQIQSPHVVPFVDVGTAGGMHYLAWPLVEGEPLDKVVERRGKLPPGEAARVVLQTAEGLAATHQRGIIHGLLKPSNLLVSTEGEIRILDFGIGSLLSETEDESVVDTMSQANTMVSGLVCSAPESIEDPNKLSPLADQYSLGCILYYCLTGNYPFPGNNAVELMMAHQLKQPTAVRQVAPDVPEALVKVCERLMQKKPEDRYPSISDAILALRPLADETGRAPATARAAPMAKQARPARPAPKGDSAAMPAAPDAPPARRAPGPGPALPSRESFRKSAAGDVPPAPARKASPSAAGANPPPKPQPPSSSGNVRQPTPPSLSRPVSYKEFLDTPEEKQIPIGVALLIVLVTLIVLGVILWLITGSGWPW